MIKYRNILIFVVLCAFLFNSCQKNPLGDDNFIQDPTALETDSLAPMDFLINEDDFIQNPNQLLKVDGLFGANYKWHHRNLILPKQQGVLYWAIDSGCKDQINTRQIAALAFSNWQPYVPFLFKETTNPEQANIVIRFINKQNAPLNTGEKPWWTESSITLGFGYAPFEKKQGLGFDYWGDIIINDYFVDWSKNPVTISKPNSGLLYKGTFNLEKVLTHEIGHALGLSHDQSSPKNIMYSNGPVTSNGSLYDGDIKYITRLYDFAYQIVYGQEYSSKNVSNFYKQIINTNISSSNLKKYEAKLTFSALPSRDNYSLTQYISEIASSDDNWIACGKSSETYLKSVYKSLLDRSPSEAEISNWKNSLGNNQATRQKMVNTLIASDEWQMKMMQKIYRNLLDSEIDNQMAKQKITQFKNSTFDIRAISYSILKSEEFLVLSNPQTTAGVIYRSYVKLLDVRPSTAKFNDWLTWVD